ncbi:MAG TPA: hypothetical protein VH370_14980 [Humisphaera sp.]|jgi:hypothetical protein|nr:hypothetical protein [Humisphaera sp.]
MRRFRHIFLNLAGVMSAFLFIATIILWARSYRHPRSAGEADSVDFTYTDPLYWLISNPGRLTFCRQVGKDWPSPQRQFEFLGLEFARGSNGKSSLINLLIPYWMLSLATAMLPAQRLSAWRVARRARQRKRLGLCTRCGYDLRASSGRCPECGAIPEQTAG